jgi:hypothetical protein
MINGVGTGKSEFPRESVSPFLRTEPLWKRAEMDLAEWQFLPEGRPNRRLRDEFRTPKDHPHPADFYVDDDPGITFLGRKSGPYEEWYIERSVE